jgi:ferritin
MLSKAMLEAINEQIKNELYSSYLYLSMAAYFESQTLPGFAQWMRVQDGEERAHAMKFFDYVYDRGGSVTLQAIDQPPSKFEGPLDVFEKTLAHEKKVTAMIHHLYELALKDKDYASQVMLQWFINEQVEEEKNDTQIIEKLKMVEDKCHGGLMLDHEMGKRGKD